ncbi:MAG: PAS domain-containing protein [Deltaproteobacteria bacterium]|nr:PAS domain-containing protein [Deltaproteobacteria bacterium]
MESAQRDLEELVFRTLLERAVPVAIFCWRATEGWPVEFVSSNVSHVLGYGAEDFLSGRVVYARAIHPDDLPKVTREVEEHSASGDLVFEHEDYRLIDPEGRVIWVRDLTAIIRDDAGQITRYIGYIFECTARHEALDALALARRKAEAATLAKTEFFNNVSHEFRTPLTLMLGPLEDLLAGARGELPGPVGAELVMVHRNAQRLLKLVDALLDFSRLEAGRAEASFEPVDLAALTTDLASTFRSAVERRGRAAGGGLPRPAGARLRRPRDVGADRAQPPLQRVQVHALGGDRGLAGARRRGRAAGGARLGRRHPPGGASPPLRALPSGARGGGAQLRGDGHRPRAGAGAHPPPRRHGLGGERAGAGVVLHRARPSGLRPPAPGAPLALAPPLDGGLDPRGLGALRGGGATVAPRRDGPGARGRGGGRRSASQAHRPGR